MATPDANPNPPPYDVAAIAHLFQQAIAGAPTTPPILQQILAGAEAFLTGAPVHIAEKIPTEQLNFTAKNPFGVTYNFTFSENNGKVVLKGTPQ